jgi:SAM-dependent methyltransferase
MKSMQVEATLRISPSGLVACFGLGSTLEPLAIPGLAALAALEILAHEPDVDAAYRAYAEIARAAVPAVFDNPTTGAGVAAVLASPERYRLELRSRPFALIVCDEAGRRAFDWTRPSVATKQVLRALALRLGGSGDLAAVGSFMDFAHVVASLEAIGVVAPARGAIDFGDLARRMPICPRFGFSRGTPIDRYYLRRFVDEVRGEVRGEVLEIGGNLIDRRAYGFGGVTAFHALELAPGPGVSIVGDAHAPEVIAPESFDAILAFNVLEHCAAPWVVAANIHRWLRPGGKAYCMVPSVQRVHRFPDDYWRPMPQGMERLFSMFRHRRLHVYGNPMTAVAALHGVAAEELRAQDLDATHPDYPVTTCIVAEK